MSTNSRTPQKRIKITQKTHKIIYTLKICLILFISLFWLFLFIDFDVMFNNSQVSFWAHTPTIVEQDEEFTLTIEAWDKFERLAGDYQGQIEIGIESYDINNNFSSIKTPIWSINETTHLFTSNFIWKGLYPAYHISGANNGLVRFKVKITTPGLHYIRVKEIGTDDVFRSNPIIVKPIGTVEERIYWGDIHGHSIFSDGSGHPREVYRFGRDVALLDFMALTDHAEMFPMFGGFDIFGRFREYKDITNAFDQDGRFSTLIALEWTPLLTGLRDYVCSEHMNFYFRGDDMPYFSTLYNVFTPDQAYQFLDEQFKTGKYGDSHTTNGARYMSWTHHPTRNDYRSDFGFYNESINRMIEIYSCHGSGEFIGGENLYPTMHEVPADEKGYSINDAFKMGRKFGIMASSDSHDGRMGHDILHTNARALNQYPFTFSAYRYGVPYPGGLTGIFAKELTRESIFDNLYNRSAYATTWINRHYLDFSINGIRPGVNDSEVVLLSPTDIRNIEITAAADGLSVKPNSTTKIEKIQIFKNSELWKTRIVKNFAYHWELNDSEALSGAEYTDCIQKPDGNFYIHETSLKPVNPDELNTGGADYYYVRLIDSNKGAAWIGPIWVRTI